MHPVDAKEAPASLREVLKHVLDPLPLVQEDLSTPFALKQRPALPANALAGAQTAVLVDPKDVSGTILFRSRHTPLKRYSVVVEGAPDETGATATDKKKKKKTKKKRRKRAHGTEQIWRSTLPGASQKTVLLRSDMRRADYVHGSPALQQMMARHHNPQEYKYRMWLRNPEELEAAPPREPWRLVDTRLDVPPRQLQRVLKKIRDDPDQTARERYDTNTKEVDAQLQQLPPDRHAEARRLATSPYPHVHTVCTAMWLFSARSGLTGPGVVPIPEIGYALLENARYYRNPLVGVLPETGYPVPFGPPDCAPELSGVHNNRNDAFQYARAVRDYPFVLPPLQKIVPRVGAWLADWTGSTTSYAWRTLVVLYGAVAVRESALVQQLLEHEAAYASYRPRFMYKSHYERTVQLSAWRHGQRLAARCSKVALLAGWSVGGKHVPDSLLVKILEYLPPTAHPGLNYQLWALENDPGVLFNPRYLAGLYQTVFYLSAPGSDERRSIIRSYARFAARVRSAHADCRKCRVGENGTIFLRGLFETIKTATDWLPADKCEDMLLDNEPGMLCMGMPPSIMLPADRRWSLEDADLVLLVQELRDRHGFPIPFSDICLCMNKMRLSDRDPVSWRPHQVRFYMGDNGFGAVLPLVGITSLRFLMDSLRAAVLSPPDTARGSREVISLCHRALLMTVGFERAFVGMHWTGAEVRHNLELQLAPFGGVASDALLAADLKTAAEFQKVERTIAVRCILSMEGLFCQLCCVGLDHTLAFNHIPTPVVDNGCPWTHLVNHRKRILAPNVGYACAYEYDPAQQQRSGPRPILFMEMLQRAFGAPLGPRPATRFTDSAFCDRRIGDCVQHMCTGSGTSG